MQPMMIALIGVPLRSRRVQIRQPGTAPSRLNANVIRDMLVTQLIPQKNCPIVEMMMTALKKPDESAVWKMYAEKPPALVSPSGSFAANRNARSRIQPPTAE